jgi:septum site-determining protein MinD
MGDSIAVSSGKGGTGKTNVAINLGVALADLGKSVAIVDASLTTPDISLHLGIPFHVKSLSHVLKENSGAEESVYTHRSGAKIIPGNIHVDVLKEFEGKKFSKLLKNLKKENDFVLVDCAAGLGREAVSAIKNCDKMLAVANPELACAVNCSKAVQISKDMKVEPMGVVLNRINRHKYELNEKDIKHLLNGMPIIGRISEDENVAAAIRKSKSILEYDPGCDAAKEFRNIALALAGERPPKRARKQKKSRRAASKIESYGGSARNPSNGLEISKTIPKNDNSRAIIESLKKAHSQ